MQDKVTWQEKSMTSVIKESLFGSLITTKVKMSKLFNILNVLILVTSHIQKPIKFT